MEIAMGIFVILAVGGFAYWIYKKKQAKKQDPR